MYIIGMNQLKSEEMLSNFTVQMFPSMKKDAMNKNHREVYKNAFPEQFNSPKRIVKTSDLAKVLSGR